MIVLNKNHNLNLRRRLWLLGLPSMSGGTFLYDLVGQNHGRIPNDVSRWTPNLLRDSYSLYFPGNSNTVLSPFVLRPPTPITISFWNYVKASDLSGLSVDPISFTIGNRNTPDLAEAAVPARDHILYWDYGAPLSQGRISCPYGNYLDKWTHVVLQSYGYTLSSMKVYLDGKLAASTTKSVGPSATTLTGIYLGGFPAQSRFFKGQMDSFSLWDYFLSTSEVQELYQEETNGYKNTLDFMGQYGLHITYPRFSGSVALSKRSTLLVGTRYIPLIHGVAVLSKRASFSSSSSYRPLFPGSAASSKQAVLSSSAKFIPLRSADSSLSKQGVLSSGATHVRPNYGGGASLSKGKEISGGATAYIPIYHGVAELSKKCVPLATATSFVPVYHGAISVSTHLFMFNMTNEEVSATYRVPPHGSASLTVYPEVDVGGMYLGEGFIQKKKHKFGSIV